MSHGAGRALPPPSAFAGDDGSADRRLRAALDALAAGSGSVPDVVVALAGARVLVPVVAALEAEGVGHAGLHVDKEASAGIVALRTPDGRTALPVFSALEAVREWQADARPIPSEAPRAAAAALQEGWEVLVLDPAGPVPVVVPHPAVRALASGTAWDPAVRDGEVRPEIRSAVSGALSGVPEVRHADAVPGARAEVAVVVGLRPGLDRPALDAVLRRVGGLMAADATVTANVDTVELRVVTAQ